MAGVITSVSGAVGVSVRIYRDSLDVYRITPCALGCGGAGCGAGGLNCSCLSGKIVSKFINFLIGAIGAAFTVTGVVGFISICSTGCSFGIVVGQNVFKWG